MSEPTTLSPGLFTRLWRLAFPQPPLTKEPNALRIGILGAANIAPMAVILPSRLIPSVIISSVAARDEARAKKFAAKHQIPHTHSSYDALVNDEGIDAVYIPLPNGLHYEWTLKAIQAGKHVLLEKPSSANAEQTAELVAAADAKGVILLEAFHYRFHPATKRAVDILNSGELGGVQRIECNAIAPNVFGDDDIRFNYSLAGGACMDIGSYMLHAIRLMAGGGIPDHVEATAQLTSPEVDHTMHTQLTFSNGIVAKGTASLKASWFNFMPTLKVTGTDKEMEIKNFILPSLWHSIRIRSSDTGKSLRTEKCYGNGDMTYTYMLRHFAELCQRRTTEMIVSHKDTLNNMQTMDMVYKAAGLTLRGTV
ncbi:NAD(P)-binding protein [Syncephalis fuscata]|nr:NAD(P)-binding protein [Syncephalis fuscata]